MQRWMTRPRWRGSVGFSSPTGGGVSRRIEVIVETGVSPWNGRCPVDISYSTTPSEKTSDRVSTGLPSACSGDM
jgi:hypothetical protein